MSENWLHSAPLTPYDQPFRAQRPAFTWLLQREIVRYMKVWYYTVAGQVLAALLFVFVFGLALGSRIDPVRGVPYDQFILPGLVVLAVITAVLASPLRWWEINLALVLGSIVRGVLISSAILAIAMPLTGSHIARPWYLLAAFGAILLLSAQAGMIAAMYNQTQEHVAAIQVLIVQPLCFLGGVFYSVHDLAPAWRTVSHLNPVFYAVQALRYGMIGDADIAPTLALLVVIGAAVVVGGFLAHKFRTGDRLKP